MSRRIQVGEVVKDVFPVFDLDGYSTISGLVDFTISVFIDAANSPISVNISEIGTSGNYAVTWTPTETGFYIIQVLVDDTKDIWGGEYDVIPYDEEEITLLLRRVLGLSQENVFIDNTSYDVDSQLLSSRVRIFDSKAHCEAATPGGTETDGLVSTYTQTTTWSAVNRFRTYRQVQE